MPLREGKPSDFFGRWFKEHRNALGLTGTRPDFHCFRHTVRPLMRKAGHSEGTMDKVTGHKIVGSIGTVVYDHRTLSEVREAVEAIRYPALKLSTAGLTELDRGLRMHPMIGRTVQGKYSNANLLCDAAV